MPSKEQVVHDGPIFKLVRRRYNSREPEFWTVLRKHVTNMYDATGLLAVIEHDLKAVLAQEGTLRQETNEERVRALSADTPPGGVVERRIDDTDLVVTFSREPTARAEVAMNTLESLQGLRRYLEQHPDTAYGLVAAYLLGLSMQKVRVMGYETDTGLGQRYRRLLRENGKKRGGKNLSRNSTIRMQFSQMRADETAMRDADIYRQLALEHGLSAERIRQIVRE